MSDTLTKLIARFKARDQSYTHTRTIGRGYRNQCDHDFEAKSIKGLTKMHALVYNVCSKCGAVFDDKT